MKRICLVLLFVAGMAIAAVPPPIGIIYETTSDQAGEANNESYITNVAGWTNPYVQCVGVRTTWARVEGDSTVGSSKGVFYWGFLDAAKAAAALHHMKWSVLITAGVTTPANVYIDGAYSFTESTSGMPMPFPWDTVFQSRWHTFVQTFAARYGSDPNLVYVVMGGFGRRSESAFITSSGDQTSVDALAAASGHNWSPFSTSSYNSQTLSPGTTAWVSGANWCVAQYATYFTTVPFIVDSGNPWGGTPSGNAAMQEVCDVAHAASNNLFGFKTDGLVQNGPSSPAIGYTEEVALAATSLVGYQFNNTSHLTDPTFNNTLLTALNNQAKFIEVYPSNCDDGTLSADLVSATARMLATSDGTAGGLGGYLPF